MGLMIKDSTTLDILVQLNRRFESEALPEMVELQREFGVFSLQHALQQSFALLGIVPQDWTERRRWYRFLEHLRTYPSDIAGVNGHDRVIRAFKDDLESEKPLPVSIVCHSAAEDPRVTVSKGRPVVFSLETHVIVSIPTTPGREARQNIAEEARARRVQKRGKK
ncbi:hypothetical protein [Bradyrhizobium sp. STM 3809]|uniref:hypothetical protein n=1 Tax=Bradyrhizobium sp. STM 3809 TaxID=551936 RepID=UPI001F0A1654|nr:hypothetical protein [Bradyrhizobium sp. STM 3809]